MKCSTCGRGLGPDGLVCGGCGAPTTRTLLFDGDLALPLTFGRDPACDIVLDLPVVSSRHGQVRVEAGSLQVRDSGSRNGTLVDGVLALEWATVTPESDVRLGSYVLPVSVLAGWRQRLTGSAAAPGSAPATVSLAVGQALVLGRDPAAGVCIDHPTVSWHHARVERLEDGLYLSDLRSTNGTFVNGARIRRARIAATDRVRLGSVPVSVGEGAVSAGRTYRGEVRLDVREVTRRLEDGRVLLDAVSLSVFPGEMVALMGPSGAGKTTLLELLTGQRRPSAGSVTLNDLDLHANRESLAHMIGYVPQEDVMHRDLTVFEVLFHAARLRLPSDLPDSAVVAQVDGLIGKIGLAHVRDSLIGGEAVRGISGGQRKRVNIAIELLTEPPLLFLDEPTSGLDATATLEVLQLLRSLAQEGRTVVMTVHQPRLEAFRLMDMLLLLEKGGRLAYFGPAVPQAATYFEGHAGPMPKGANPADFVLDVLDAAKAPPGTWQARFRESALHRQYVGARLEERGSVELRESSERRRGVPGPLLQVRAMLRRQWDRKRRDRDALVLQALQPVVVGGLLAWVFHDGGGWPFVAPEAPQLPLLSGAGAAALPVPAPPDPCASDAVLALQAATPVHAVLFLVAATAFWLGCSNVARELVAERAVFRRERMAGLSTGAYLSASVLAQAAVGALQVLALVGFAWGGDLSLHASALTGAGLAFLALLCGVSVGTVVSASVRTEVTAISTLPLLLLPQLMLAGYIVLWRELSGALTALASGMPVRWAFEALTDAEYAAASPACSLEQAIGFVDGVPPVAVLAGMTLLALGVARLRLSREGSGA